MKNLISIYITDFTPLDRRMFLLCDIAGSMDTNNHYSTAMMEGNTCLHLHLERGPIILDRFFMPAIHTQFFNTIDFLIANNFDY